VNAGGRSESPSPGPAYAGPSSVSFWTQPNRSRLVGGDDDSNVPSPKLPMHGLAGRGSRSDSGLPPFDPCTAPERLVILPEVGHAFTGSPPGWESHPHGCQVVRGSFMNLCDCYPPSCERQLSVNGSHQIQRPAAPDVDSGRAQVFEDRLAAAAGVL
jgi:hypothetical protein